VQKERRDGNIIQSRRFDLDVNAEAAIDTPATATNKSMHN